MHPTTLEFPIMRYRLDFSLEKPMRLPEYAGSLLRGAFGHALRQLACMTKQPSCEGCFLRQNCAYKQIFEPEVPTDLPQQKYSAIPVPIVIEPPPWGRKIVYPDEPLSFHMTMMGKALEHLPLIVMAWQRAFARGIGKEKATAKLLSVSTDTTVFDQQLPFTVYTAAEGTILTHAQVVRWDLKPQNVPTSLTLHLTTPMLLQVDGRPAFIEELTPTILVKALLRRLNLLSEFHVGEAVVSKEHFAELLEPTHAMTSDKKLHWYTWTRNSSRQQQIMHFSGAKGVWEITGDWSKLYGYLQLGQLTHVGKEAVFGMGQYHMGS